MFGRKREERGLYTGDAPVSAPGFGGAEPTPYHGSRGTSSFEAATGPAGSVGTEPSAQTYPPAQSYPPTQAAPPGGYPPSGPAAAGAGVPSAAGFGSSDISVSGALPSDADLARLEQLVARKVPPQFAGMAVEQIERLRAQGARAGAAGQAGSARFGAPPAGGPSYRAASVPVAGIDVRSHKGRASGCFLSLVLLVGLIVGGALLIVNKVGDAVRDRGGSSSSPTGTIGAPITAHYGTATLSLTVGRAVAQPGAPWSMAFSGATPTLLVEVNMTRTDGGTSPVTVIGWDWAFTATGTGRRVTGDIIGDYQPDMTGPKLAGGESAHGWLSFDTDATSGTLSFSDALASKPSVSWSIVATKAAPVTGTLGTPAQGVVSAPDFTVTVSSPRSVADSSAGVKEKSDSGRYLLADVAFDAAPDLDGIDAQIRDDTFVFVPTGGRALTSTPGAVAHAIDWTVLSSDARTTAVLAFDTTATSGTLSMQDAAGNVVVVWKITVPGSTATGTAGRSGSGSGPATTAAVAGPTTGSKAAGPTTTGPRTGGATAAPKTAPKTG